MLSPPFRINPNPEARLQEIADGRFCAVVDDVPEHPESLVNFATRHKSRFASHGDPPHRRMDVGENELEGLNRLIRSRLCRYFPIHPVRPMRLTLR